MTLSSTVPTDFPPSALRLPRTAFEDDFDLLASRARCREEPNPSRQVRSRGRTNEKSAASKEISPARHAAAPCFHSPTPTLRPPDIVTASVLSGVPIPGAAGHPQVQRHRKASSGTLTRVPQQNDVGTPRWRAIERATLLQLLPAPSATHSSDAHPAAALRSNSLIDTGKQAPATCVAGRSADFHAEPHAIFAASASSADAAPTRWLVVRSRILWRGTSPACVHVVGVMCGLSEGGGR